jgi:hypothetical protein
MLMAAEEVDSYSHFLVEAHDSTLAEVRIGRREDYARAMKRQLLVPIDYSKCNIPRNFQLVVPVEMNHGMTWQECSEDSTKFDVEI